MCYRLILFLSLCICGCDFCGETIKIMDGVSWCYQGIQNSCLKIEFEDVVIRGDLHIEFVEKGILVSKWNEDKGMLQYYFVDFEEKKVIGPNRRESLAYSDRRVDLFKSYHLSTLVGRNKIASERESFELECNNLKHSLSK